MRLTLAILISTLGVISCQAPEVAKDTWRSDLLRYRQDQQTGFRDTATSPLNRDEISRFQGLEYFDPDSSWRLTGTFQKSTHPDTIKMQTSDSGLRPYVTSGVLTFTREGREFQLTMYFNPITRQTPELAHHAFIPFRDATSGHETYGAGRYVELHGPFSEEVIVDFNRAFNPYCALSDRFSCAIPPRTNWLDLPIRAGEKAYLGPH